MVAIQPLHGKPLSEAADVLSDQLKFVSTAATRFRTDGPMTVEKSRELKDFLTQLDTVRGNVKMLLATANGRLESLEKLATLRLMEVGSF